MEKIFYYPSDMLDVAIELKDNRRKKDNWPLSQN